MNIAEAILDPMVGRDDLDRLDLREEGADWASIDRIVQAELAAFDEPIRRGAPAVHVRAGSNRGRSCYLFSYRVYEPSAQMGIDPVVVGVSLVPADTEGRIGVRGDISGETLGDILFEVPRREAADYRAAVEAARDVCRELARGADAAVAALRNASRKT